jgi:hypothetical protein
LNIGPDQSFALSLRLVLGILSFVPKILRTSLDNSRYARKIFPSTIPVVVPFAVPNRPGVVVPSPVPTVLALPGNSDGGGGP